MWAKCYLQQLRKLDLQIRHKRQELAAYRDDIGLSGIDYSDDPVQTSGGASQEDAIIRCIDLEQEIRESIEQLTQIRHKIISEIHALSRPEYVEVLYAKYVEHKQLKQIASELNYSHIWVRQLHAKALNDFEKQHTQTYI